MFRVLELVPTFASDLFGEIGFHVGKRTKTQYLTEVVFDDFAGDRPDGYVSIGNWTALIEVKCDGDRLDPDQLRRYVDIAKHHQINAVITISNEMVARPSHHPCFRLSKFEEKKLNLYHLSWQLIFTRLCLWAERDQELDNEQAQVISDFRNFLLSKSSGLKRFDSMSSSWKLLLQDVGKLASSEKLSVNNENASPVVRDWFFEERDLALKLSDQLKVPVRLSIPQKFASGNKSDERLEATTRELCNNLALGTCLLIPNAADKLCIRVDLAKRKIEASMRLKAKSDISTTKGRVGWLRRMLKDVEDKHLDNTFIAMRWGGNAEPKVYSAREIYDWKRIQEGLPKSVVKNFDIRMFSNDTIKFQSPTKFIAELEYLTSLFYRQVGEKLKPWTPPPPKITKVIGTQEN